MLDSAAQLLLPHLHTVSEPTLWYADESAGSLLSQVHAQPGLTLVTNRYHIFQQAKARGFTAIFSDFKREDYSLEQAIAKIVYRLSKEKALVHHLINQSAQLLKPSGSLVISGNKQDGIKTYADKLKKQLNSQGQLKKQRNAYLGEFTHLDRQQPLDDQDYELIRLLTVKDHEYYSKPGVFGWDKIDVGTTILLDNLKNIYSTLSPRPKTALDLGCGYGWIFMNLAQLSLESMTATDNNAAALLCAKKNALTLSTPIEVIASDCADTINHTFDLVICNPPFHQGKQHSQALTQQFIDSAYQHLNPQGHAFFVVNEFIPLEKLATTRFSHIDIIKQQQHFKCILLRK